jgi:hypothetical protein
VGFQLSAVKKEGKGYFVDEQKAEDEMGKLKC